MPERNLKCVPSLKELNAYYNDFEGMKIKVRSYKNRGLGIQATEDIPKGRVVAYYRVRKVNVNSHTKCSAYTVDVGNQKDGVLDETLVYGTYRNIPYVGSFCNEPGYDKTENVDLYDASPTNIPGFKDMKLVSTRNIKKGEEIVWCYGKSYGKRNYETRCEQ
tara:strand:+ start:3903 stop:4388 length:486 start_codon:yes stop_codon:yes gene_type:complete